MRSSHWQGRPAKIKQNKVNQRGRKGKIGYAHRKTTLLSFCGAMVHAPSCCTAPPNAPSRRPSRFLVLVLSFSSSFLGVSFSGCSYSDGARTYFCYWTSPLTRRNRIGPGCRNSHTCSSLQGACISLARTRSPSAAPVSQLHSAISWAPPREAGLRRAEPVN